MTSPEVEGTSRGEQRALKERLLDWLRTQGYPMELRVGHAFRGSGFGTLQSVFYVDPSSETPREIDVIAWRLMRFAVEVVARIEVVVECKSSKSKPWILLAAETDRVPMFLHRSFIMTRDAQRLWARVRVRPETDDISLFKPSPLSYGIIQGLSEKQRDVAYDAERGVLSAAIGRMTESEKAASNHPVLDVFIPTIVIDAPLFQYRLDKDGNDVLDEISRGYLLSRQPLANRDSTVIQVVTLTVLSELIAEIEAAAEIIQRTTSDDVESLFNTWLREKRSGT